MALMLAFCEQGDTPDRPRGGIKHAVLSPAGYITGSEMANYLDNGVVPTLALQSIPRLTRQMVSNTCVQLRRLLQLDLTTVTRRLVTREGRTWTSLSAAERTMYTDRGQARLDNIKAQRDRFAAIGFYPSMGYVPGAFDGEIPVGQNLGFFKTDAVVVLNVNAGLVYELNATYQPFKHDTELPPVNWYGVDLDDARFDQATKDAWADPDVYVPPPEKLPGWDNADAFALNEIINLNTQAQRDLIASSGESGRADSWQKTKDRDIS